MTKKMNEREVFSQMLDEDELNDVIGGVVTDCYRTPHKCPSDPLFISDEFGDCVGNPLRDCYRTPLGDCYRNPHKCPSDPLFISDEFGECVGNPLRGDCERN